MVEQNLRLDQALDHAPGPAPAELTEGLATDGAPLALRHDPALASLPPPPASPAPEFDWDLILESLQNALSDTVPQLQWFFLLTFFVLYGGSLLLNLISLALLKTRLREQDSAVASRNAARHEIPISLILPVGNDTATAIAEIHALLQLEYSEFEIILVSDRPQQMLAREFSLSPFPEVCRDHLPCRHVNAIHASTAYPGLRLVDKERGGWADALNAALNCARYPLFVSLGNGLILRRDSLRVMGRAFQNDTLAMAACASIGVANGCTLQGGFMGEVSLPRTWPARFQAIEILRDASLAWSFWSRLNALLPASGAFTVFRKDAVLAAGGYRTDAMNEEMELMARIHRLKRSENTRYHIVHVPDRVCWKHVSENWKDLKKTYMERQGGMVRSLEMNRRLLLGGKSGIVGWVNFPLLLLFDWLAPLLEVLGYVSMVLLWLFGLLPFHALWAFLLVAISLGLLQSTGSLLLDELAFPAERKLSHALRLFVAAVVENLGYRQLMAFWRAIGVLREILRPEVK